MKETEEVRNKSHYNSFLSREAALKSHSNLRIGLDVLNCPDHFNPNVTAQNLTQVALQRQKKKNRK